MEPFIVGMLGFILLVILILLGVHLGISLLVTGIIGMAILIGPQNTLPTLGGSLYTSSTIFAFVCLPLFLLMGSFAVVGGFAERAYTAVRGWLGGLPGSLAISTCLGSAAFGALTGSSTATVAVFGKISLPSMLKYNYQKALSLGCVAAAGTFSTMIPPSGLLIVYGIFTEQSIGKLFMAGILPGVCTALVYSLLIVIRVWRSPKLAPMIGTLKLPWREKIMLAWRTWPVVILVTIVLGGIYTGLLTVTEAAAAGALAAFLLAGQQVGFRAIPSVSVLKETAKMTAMIMLLIMGALFFSRFIALSQLAVAFTNFLHGLAVPHVVIFAGIILMYFLLGMFVTATGIIAITIPVVFPLILSLGYDPIWFGIILIKVCEIGFVTPPVGLNIYVLKGVLGKEASLSECFAGIWPFILCDCIMLALLFLFPQIALFLPNRML